MATAVIKKRQTDETNDGNFTITVEYLVSGLTPDSSDATIYAVVGVSLNAAATGGAVATRRSISYDADRKGGGTEATVIITYSTKPATGNVGSQPDNDRDPTTDPPEITAFPEGSTEDAHEDYSSPKKAYKNSSGEMLDPLPQRETGRTVIQYTKNVTDFAEAVNANSKAGKVNSSSITLSTLNKSVTIGAKKALFRGVGLQQMFYTDGNGNVTPYWRASYTFVVSGKDWNPTERADWGMCEKFIDPTDGEWRQRPISWKGAPLNSPVALDGNGSPVDLSDPAAKPAKLTFKDYEETDLGVS